MIVSVVTAILFLISFKFRTVGFVLVFPMIWFWIPEEINFSEMMKKIHFSWFIGFGVTLIGFIFFISQQKYFTEGFQIFHSKGYLNYFATILSFRITEFGEMFLNFPFTNIPNQLLIFVSGVG